ncbi:MAG: FAD-dependent oxidoreductase [Alphaproteobacteria bacterium]|nr:FAD-dependent oxidoreductase [Alphaproteobacteria bacterium]
MAARRGIRAVSERFDVAIIGAGVVGCAVAREFSRYRLRTVLIEARSDLGDGASKGNSAILSTGSDTPFGTLENRLVTRGHERYRAEAPAMSLPILSVGSLTVAWNEQQATALAELHRATVAAGYADATLVDRAAIYRRVPELAPGAVAAVWEPEEAVVDPFSTPYAFALDAVANGVAYHPSSPVTAAVRDDAGWALATPGGTVLASLAINCGGLWGDRVDALAGLRDFAIRPRRGEFIVFDKSARELLDVILKPVPMPSYRGVLMAPTVFGNVLLGPTAEDIDDPEDWRVTCEGLGKLDTAARAVLPALLRHEVTATYCGLRPATERPEYRIRVHRDRRWITVGGIRSTGLSGSLGIAEHVAELAFDGLVRAERKADVVPVRVPSLLEGGTRPWMDEARAARDPAYAEIVCHCEGVSLGEIRDALASPLPPRSLKALKRRTRAMFGRCQGFFCGARVQAAFEQSTARRAAE